LVLVDLLVLVLLRGTCTRVGHRLELEL